MGKAVAMNDRGASGATLLLAGAVVLLALPSAVLAFSNRYEALPGEAASGPEMITPGRLDPRLARSISVRALTMGEMFRFTPASVPSRLSRDVTVAVLTSPVAQTILVSAPSRGALPQTQTGNPLGVAPMAYDLGVARGYKGFAPSAARPAPARSIAMPDLEGYDLRSTPQASGARFSPRIELDERANAGRSPRTFEGDGEQTVDVGGSYRVGRNLDVTAGVRYSQERDRLRPVDTKRQDGQAVYVGTQFRF
jgi:hypothetical protein